MRYAEAGRPAIHRFSRGYPQRHSDVSPRSAHRYPQVGLDPLRSGFYVSRTRVSGPRAQCRFRGRGATGPLPGRLGSIRPARHGPAAAAGNPGFGRGSARRVAARRCRTRLASCRHETSPEIRPAASVARPGHPPDRDRPTTGRCAVRHESRCGPDRAARREPGPGPADRRCRRARRPGTDHGADPDAAGGRRCDR